MRLSRLTSQAVFLGLCRGCAPGSRRWSHGNYRAPRGERRAPV